MISLLVFIAVLGLLILVHEFGHFIAARRVGVRVERFSLGFGPKIFSRKKDDTEYCVNALPLGGYVKLSGDNLEEYKGNSYEYYAKSPLKRLQIIFFGPLLNYILGFIFFWLIFFVGYPTLTTRVGGLLEGFGAEKAGLKHGDKILAVDGQKVDFWEQLQKIIQSKKEATEVQLTLLRDNQEFKVNVRIREKELEDELGQKHNLGLLGITPDEEFVIVRHTFLESFVLGINRTLFLTELMYKGLWRVITGRLSVRDSVAGPLRIFAVTSQAVRHGIIAVLHLMAVLNVSLAVFNLLPLPVLDGGHILFLVLEKIRGRTLSQRAEQIITQIGLALIVSLAIFVTYNDIIGLFGEKISVFLKR